MFKVVIDKWGGEYFSVDLDNAPARNISWAIANNAGTMLNPSINITTRVTGPFSSDLTKRDDVLLAFMSLLLLLVIEGLVTTVLLRTKDGNVSNFGFSVKQIVALFQELNFRGIFKGRKTDTREHRKINYKLLIFAVMIISSTFLLEVAVLFLTSPVLRDVTNKTATFRMLEPVMPDWHDVRYHNGRSVDRPCEAFVVQNVEQGQTRVNGCTSSSISGEEVQLFVQEEKSEVDAEITTLLHEYGAEHTVILDGRRAKYSTRAYFSLSDGETRVMKTGPNVAENEKEQVDLLHKQYFAYLLSVYKVLTKDESVSVDTLNAMKFAPMETGSGGEVNVLPLPGTRKRISTRRYKTQVTGFMPTGIPSLRLAQHTFRGAGAIYVAGPDTRDLTIENGVKDVEAVVWQEEVRVVNWLSLALILLLGMGLLWGLRIVMKPVATAEIAGIFVKGSVEADFGRAPFEVGEGERLTFRVKDLSDGDYVYGAETTAGWVLVNSEYNDARV